MKAVVLHVEDDPNDAYLVKAAFEKSGYSGALQTVDDGAKAADYLSGVGDYADRVKHPFPSLILLDIKLPRMSGLELLEWLRGRPLLRQIPVVMLTSSKADSDISRAYELGANSYLAKPLTFDELLELVKLIQRYWLDLNQNSPVFNAPR